MNPEVHHKVTPAHLKRDAYLYVRQSTLRQVFENTESTRRQYGLRQRAVALGWSMEQIHVIDCDQGQSGASREREGFRHLVAEVSLGRAGIVLGLEVSRLARNSVDWHRLLEICALSQTLILDEDGVYDPCQFNDRLLLGLKGTMSEAELHVLRARLRGGILNKARRGELQTPLPVGLVYDAKLRVRLDPDQQVQESLRQLFRTFQRTGSARATVKAFRDQGLLFPRRLLRGARKGELLWAPLQHCRVLQVLHNPRYAGAFCFGRHRTQRGLDGRTTTVAVPRDQWHAFVRDAHPGYISWEEFEENQKRLGESAHAHGRDRRRSPPREGPALLQGRVMCGVCGARMTVRYVMRGGRPSPHYVCQKQGIETATPICQQIPGQDIDEAIGALLVDTITPTALEVALQVQEELRQRAQETDRLRRQQVERARYEADLARQRFMRVDPDNRLVADELEAEWNQCLRGLAEAQDHYERACKADGAVLGEEERERILALASDFPALWRSSKTPDRERKRMLRLIIEDVALLRDDEITVHVRFRGGATQSLHLPLPRCAWQLRQTPPQVVHEVDRLLNDHTTGEVADLLNQDGLRGGDGKPFHLLRIQRLIRDYHLESRFDRLRHRGLLTLGELAERLGVARGTIRTWRQHGLLQGHVYNDRPTYLYEDPGEDPPRKMQGTKLNERAAALPSTYA